MRYDLGLVNSKSLCNFVWWRHGMETPVALLALGEENPRVTGGPPPPPPPPPLPPTHKRQESYFSLLSGCTTMTPNERDDGSNHQPHDCSLNLLFKAQIKKNSKLRVTGLYAANSTVTGEFPAQMTSNAENVSIWWRHHVNKLLKNSRIFGDLLRHDAHVTLP